MVDLLSLSHVTHDTVKKTPRNLSYLLTGKNALYNNYCVHFPHSNMVGHFLRAWNTFVIRNGLCRGPENKSRICQWPCVCTVQCVPRDLYQHNMHSRLMLYATSSMWSRLRFRPLPPFELVSSPQVMIQARAARQFPAWFSCGWSRMQAGWNGPPQADCWRVASGTATGIPVGRLTPYQVMYHLLSPSKG